MYKKMSAKEFAMINDITLEDLPHFSDAYYGAENLHEDTILHIYTEQDSPLMHLGDIFVVYRCDNPWNEDVLVIASKSLENWVF